MAFYLTAKVESAKKSIKNHKHEHAGEKSFLHNIFFYKLKFLLFFFGKTSRLNLNLKFLQYDIRLKLNIYK